MLGECRRGDGEVDCSQQGSDQRGFHRLGDCRRGDGQVYCFRFASSASALEDQWPCGKELCNFSSEAFVCVNFRSLASYWPRPWSDFGVPLGAWRPPKGGPEISKRQPQTTQTVSLECLWAAFGGRASRGGPGASRRQPGRPKRGLPLQSRAVF